MNNFANNLAAKLSQFMQGRNGTDALGISAILAAVVAKVLAVLFGSTLLDVLSLALILYALFRCYSRNTIKRAEENLAFLDATKKPREWASLAYKKVKNRKTTCYFTCENCKTVYALPKGKGKLRATCPKCHARHEHTT